VTQSLKSRILSGGLWALGGRFLSMGANFVAFALVVRLIGKDAFADYGLALSLVNVGAVLAPLGVQFAAVRLIATAMAREQPGVAHGTVATVLRYAFLGNVLAAATLLSFGIPFLSGLWNAPVLERSALAIVVWLALVSMQIVLAEVFRGFQDLRLATLCGGAITWTVTVILLASSWLTRGTLPLDHVIAIGIAASAGNALFALILLRGKLRRLGPPVTVAAPVVLGIALPLWINGITANVHGQVDLWVLGTYLAKHDVAVYVLGARPVAMVTMWLLLVNMIVPPFIAELYARGETKRLERVLRRTATVAGIPAFAVLLAFLLFGGTLLGWIGGPEFSAAEYRTSALVLAILSFGQLVVVAGAPSTITLAMTGHHRTLMWITIGSSTVTALATWWAAQTVGILGVAAAAAGGQIALTVATWLTTKLCTGMWTHVGAVRLSELRQLIQL
jgi:O-antigen/teichoic acid export membrane protein